MRVWPLMLLLALAGCEHVEADHPLDPDSPSARQHRARLRGQLEIPSRPDGAAVFAVSEVRLYAGDGEAAPAETSPVDHLGNFLFEAVLAGSYVVRFHVPGHEAPPLFIDLDPGEDFHLGSITARPDAAAVADAAVAGQVALGDGAAPRGVLVEDGAGRVAVTDPEGRFRLVLPPGEATLRFSQPGYAPERRTVTAGPGETVTLDAVTLAALPAVVTGTVALRQLHHPARLAAAAVRLLDAEGAEVVRAAVAEDGTFTLEAPSGDLLLEAAAPGYDPLRRPLRLRAGEHLDAGRLELSHAATGPGAVRFVGEVTLADGADPGATAVQLYLHDTDLFFARTLADADGGFRADAAPDEAYRLFVERAGYAPLDVGPYRWDPIASRFLDEQGAPPVLVLELR